MAAYYYTQKDMMEGPAGLLFQETEEYVALVTLSGTHTHHVVHSLWEDDTNTIQ